MNKLKKKISIITVFTVTTVMFLGLICPMDMQPTAVAGGCSHEQTLAISSPNQMGDCMSGKLSFLGNFLVSMPESLFFLIILAFALAFVFQAKLVKEIFSAVIPRSRWRQLALDYFNEIRIKFLKSFFFWLNTVSRPVVIA